MTGEPTTADRLTKALETLIAWVATACNPRIETSSRPLQKVNRIGLH